MCDVDGTAQGVAKALETNVTLKTLELGYNPMGPEGAKALATAIKFHGKIDTLRLGWCKVEKEGTAEFADALRCVSRYYSAFSPNPTRDVVLTSLVGLGSLVHALQRVRSW